jgi:hypothetical protein
MVRILKPIGTYSKKKANRYLMLGLLFFVPFLVLFLTSIENLPMHLHLNEQGTNIRGIYTGFFLTMGLLFLFYPYRNWRSGLIGEKTVVKNLSDKISNEYSMFNNILLKDGKRMGDIDHLIIGPTGVFVIETKNNKETVTFNGYKWEKISKSPSDQVVSNMFRVKDILKRCDVFKNREPFVDALVVFSNSKLKLKIEKPPKYCEIIQISNQTDTKLSERITNRPISFSSQEVDSIEQFLKGKISNYDEELAT